MNYTNIIGGFPVDSRSESFILLQQNTTNLVWYQRNPLDGLFQQVQVFENTNPGVVTLAWLDIFAPNSKIYGIIQAENYQTLDVF